MKSNNCMIVAHLRSMVQPWSVTFGVDTRKVPVEWTSLISARSEINTVHRTERALLLIRKGRGRVHIKISNPRNPSGQQLATARIITACVAGEKQAVCVAGEK